MKKKTDERVWKCRSLVGKVYILTPFGSHLWFNLLNHSTLVLFKPYNSKAGTKNGVLESKVTKIKIKIN